MALLLLPLLQCHFRRRATPERREAIPTHPLFSRSVPNRNPPNQNKNENKTNPIKSSSTSLKPLQ